MGLDLNEIFVNPLPSSAEIIKLLEGAFVEEYRRLYGREIEGLGIEVLSWVTRVASASQVIEPDDSDRPHSHLKTNHSAEVVDSSSGKRITAAVAPRRELSGHYIEGPALLTELQTTTFIPAGYFGWITDQGHLRVQASLNLSHSDSASEGLRELQRDIKVRQEKR